MFLATGDGQKSESSPSWLQPCRHFEFAEIQLATKNFDESLVLGRGGFGKVYKGTIVNGSTSIVAAIKRLDSMSNQGATEFWAEVEMLSKLRHSHLVSLLGYCNDRKEMILVYEYIHHGTLEDHLHKIFTPLSWLQRLKICIGAARGLEYLHTGTGNQHGVIHRDVKSSNILLHESWTAKISDFGLSKIGPKDQPTTYVNTNVKGTFGYLDPNYFGTGRLTRKSDVYAFGVVLFEVLCRKRAVDGSPDDKEWGLAKWAQESIKEGNLRCIIDPDVRNEISSKCLKEFARIAVCCLHDHPKHRPTMAEVVFSLESVLTLQEKANNSSQGAGKTIFGRVVDMLPFPSKGERSVHRDSKPSSNNKGNRTSAINTIEPDNITLLDTREVPVDAGIPSPSLQVFKFADLKKATSDFGHDRLLGERGLGKVYLGWVDKNTFASSSPRVGMAVAVKTLSSQNSQGNAKWLEEVSLLGRLTHPNIITLLGYCNDEPKKLLVYEYIHYTSFDRFLFKNAEPPSWERRLNIMLGVARGVSYLHSSEVELIHRDVKCSTILLDQDFNAKLGDFAVARSGSGIGDTTHVLGSFVYLDPEYLRTGHLTVKSDIYGFGVMLLETLTGQLAIDEKRPVQQQNLVTWIPSIVEVGKLRTGELKKIMDTRLEKKYPVEGALECVKLAVRCVALDSKDRPSAEEVLQRLEAISVVSTPPHTTIHES